MPLAFYSFFIITKKNYTLRSFKMSSEKHKIITQVLCQRKAFRTLSKNLFPWKDEENTFQVLYFYKQNIPGTSMLKGWFYNRKEVCLDVLSSRRFQLNHQVRGQVLVSLGHLFPDPQKHKAHGCPRP